MLEVGDEVYIVLTEHAHLASGLAGAKGVVLERSTEALRPPTWQGPPGQTWMVRLMLPDRRTPGAFHELELIKVCGK